MANNARMTSRRSFPLSLQSLAAQRAIGGSSAVLFAAGVVSLVLVQPSHVHEVLDRAAPAAPAGAASVAAPVAAVVDQAPAAAAVPAPQVLATELQAAPVAVTWHSSTTPSRASVRPVSTSPSASAAPAPSSASSTPSPSSQPSSPSQPSTGTSKPTPTTTTTVVKLGNVASVSAGSGGATVTVTASPLPTLSVHVP